MPKNPLFLLKNCKNLLSVRSSAYRPLRCPLQTHGCTFAIKSLLYSLNTLSGVLSERWLSPRLCARAILQGCNGSESLATCGWFNQIGIWTPYLPHPKQTFYHLCHLAGFMWSILQKYFCCRSVNILTVCKSKKVGNHCMI